MESNSVHRMEILDEIMDNAIGLPIESQNLLLMLAKGMAYTRSCLTKQNMDEKSCKPPAKHST